MSTELEKLEKYYKTVKAYYKRSDATPQELLKAANKDIEDYDTCSDDNIDDIGNMGFETNYDYLLEKLDEIEASIPRYEKVKTRRANRKVLTDAQTKVKPTKKRRVKKKKVEVVEEPVVEEKVAKRKPAKKKAKAKKKVAKKKTTRKKAVPKKAKAKRKATKKKAKAKRKVTKKKATREKAGKKRRRK